MKSVLSDNEKSEKTKKQTVTTWCIKCMVLSSEKYYGWSSQEVDEQGGYFTKNIIVSKSKIQ